MNQVILLNEYRKNDPELLDEANHRIANQLTLIVAMIQAQIAALRRGPEVLSRETAHEILRETAAKIVGISHLHRLMAERPLEAAIDLGNLLIEIVRELAASLSLGDRLSIRQSLSAGCIVSTEQAHTVSLLVSEIVMNAVKHAHPTGIPVDLSVACTSGGDGEIVLEICDDGVGLPEDFDHANGGGVGFKLIKSLAGKLNAVLQIESSDLGLCFHLVWQPSAT